MSDLIHKIVGKIIEVGQSDTAKFRLGETIRYSPSEILEILKQHENEIFGEESSTQANTSNALNALDTIYRQAAIDVAKEELDNGTFYDIPSKIESLPSAQPEIIRCGECKHSFLHDNGERVSRICGLTRMCGTTSDDWFCADAERSEE